MTMVPPAQVMQVALRTASLDESIDPKQAAPGTLTALRNAVWRKAGRVEKRPGTEDLPRAILGSDEELGTLQKVWARGGELLTTDGLDLFSYVPANQAWKRIQRMNALRATWRTVTDSGMSVIAADVDASESYVAIAWTCDSSRRLFLQVEDATTGGVVVPPCYLPATFSNGVRHLRVLLKGTTILVFWQEGNDSNLKVVAVDLTTDVQSSDFLDVTPTSLLADVKASSLPIWDLVHHGDDIAVAYKTTNDELVLATFDADLSALASEEVLASAASVNAVSLSATPDERIYVAFATADDVTPLYEVWGAIHDPDTLEQIIGPALFDFGTERYTQVSVARLTETTAVVMFTSGAITYLGVDSWLPTDTQLTKSVLIDDGGNMLGDAIRETRWARLASRVFVIDGRAYALLSSVRPPVILPNGARVQQNTVFAVEVGTTEEEEDGLYYPHRLVAVIDPRESEGLRRAQLCNVPVVNDRAYAGSLLLSPGRSALRLITFEREDTWSSASLGRGLVIGAGVGTYYDGRRAFEIGHLHPPRVIAATPGTDGNMDAGDYLYTFVYEWKDPGTGLLHRSAPCQPIRVTVSSSGSVEFKIETAATTGKTDPRTGLSANPTPVMIVPYRTKKGGTTFYRMAIEPSPTGSGGNAIVTNFVSIDSVTWIDTSADTSVGGSGRDLGTQPLLYTTGGILDEVIPPSCHGWIVHQGRLFGIAGDQRTVWASKVFLEDPTVFPGFHEALRIVFEDEVVALASLDDKLVAFSDSSIHVVFGEGPSAAGAGAWTSPTTVQSDAGCINERSIVEVPAGIMFQSARGIYLLTRGLELQWIGQPVRDHVEAYPIVLDARIVPHRSQVRYSMANAEGTAGVVLVYDYAHGFWSVWDYHDGEQPNALVRSSVVAGGTLYMTAADALVRESDETHLDRGEYWVTLELEAMLRPSGPIAWQHVRRIQLLGERHTHHDLRLRLAFDDRPTFSQDFTFPAEMVVTNNDCPTVRVGSQNGASPKCKAIRVRVTDATPTSPTSYPVDSGKGGSWSAIGLELIPRPGLPRHGARHSKV